MENVNGTHFYFNRFLETAPYFQPFNAEEAPLFSLEDTLEQAHSASSLALEESSSFNQGDIQNAEKLKAPFDVTTDVWPKVSPNDSKLAFTRPGDDSAYYPVHWQEARKHAHLICGLREENNQVIFRTQTRYRLDMGSDYFFSFPNSFKVNSHARLWVYVVNKHEVEPVCISQVQAIAGKNLFRFKMDLEQDRYNGFFTSRKNNSTKRSIRLVFVNGQTNYYSPLYDVWIPEIFRKRQQSAPLDTSSIQVNYQFVADFETEDQPPVQVETLKVPFDQTVDKWPSVLPSISNEVFSRRVDEFLYYPVNWVKKGSDQSIQWGLRREDSQMIHVMTSRYRLDMQSFYYFALPSSVKLNPQACLWVYSCSNSSNTVGAPVCVNDVKVDIEKNCFRFYLDLVKDAFQGFFNASGQGSTKRIIRLILQNSQEIFYSQAYDLRVPEVVRVTQKGETISSHHPIRKERANSRFSPTGSNTPSQNSVSYQAATVMQWRDPQAPNYVDLSNLQERLQHLYDSHMSATSSSSSHSNSTSRTNQGTAEDPVDLEE